MTTSGVGAGIRVGDYETQFRRWTSALVEYGVLWDQGAREAVYMDELEMGMREGTGCGIAGAGFG